MRFTIVALIFSSNLWLSTAYADFWNIPATIDDSNTTINFEVDSTWHMVQGSTKGVRGNLSLRESNNPRSVHGEVSLPVGQMDTDNSRRDRKMKEVMAADRFPEITYFLDSADSPCSPEQFPHIPFCKVVLHGRIKIHGIERSWDVEGHLSRTNSRFSFSGSGTILWADFGIEDPSILVARLNPQVQANILVTWPVK